MIKKVFPVVNFFAHHETAATTGHMAQASLSPDVGAG